MDKCPSCGADVCPHCGKAIDEKSTPRPQPYYPYVIPWNPTPVNPYYWPITWTDNTITVGNGAAAPGIYSDSTTSGKIRIGS